MPIAAAAEISITLGQARHAEVVPGRTARHRRRLPGRPRPGPARLHRRVIPVTPQQGARSPPIPPRSGGPPAIADACSGDVSRVVESVQRLLDLGSPPAGSLVLLEQVEGALKIAARLLVVLQPEIGESSMPVGAGHEVRFVGKKDASSMMRLATSTTSANRSRRRSTFAVMALTRLLVSFHSRSESPDSWSSSVARMATAWPSAASGSSCIRAMAIQYRLCTWAAAEPRLSASSSACLAASSAERNSPR